jgi:hypothetical protein
LNMPAPMVFISYTFLEFKKERRQLHRILTSVLPVACDIAEFLTCDTPDLEAELQKRIDKADVVVLLLGIRYGSTAGKLSWTHREVRYAKSCGKRILPYMKEQEPPSEIADIDVRKQRALKR